MHTTSVHNVTTVQQHMAKSKQTKPTAEVVRISPSLLVDLKKLAAERGTSAKALAEEAICKHFKFDAPQAIKGAA